MPQEQSAVIPEAVREEAQHRIGARFRRTDVEHPATRFLLETATERLARDMVENPGLAAASESFEADGPVSDQVPDFSAPKIAVKDVKPPPLPQVFLALQEVVDDPDSTLKDVADIVGADPGLSSFLLRLANSAFYSFPGRVDNILRAVQLIGMREIHTMALGRAVSGLFSESPDESILHLEGFWRHSTACAVMSRSLALKCGRADAERNFVSGLLHDIGKILLVISEPDMCAMLLAAARRRDVPAFTVEAEFFGFNHAELGGRVVQKWRFPEPLAKAVGFHHDPDRDGAGRGADIVHLADFLALGLGLGTRPGCLTPTLNVRVWERLGLTTEDLAAVVAECDAKLDELASLFLSN